MPDEKSLLGGDAQKTPNDGGDPKGQAGASGDQKPAGDQGAPAEVKFEFKAPEGFKPDEKLLGEMTAAAKDLGLNPEQAQKLFDKRVAEIKATPVVPEKYEFKLPEGVQADTKLVEQFTPVAKELGLTNEKAQKLVELYAGQQKAAAEATAKALSEQTAAWQKEFKSDPKHPEILADARKALTLVDAELKGLLETSWLGDHPGMLKFLAKVGKALVKEDALKEGAGGSTDSGVPLEKRLYPNMQ